MASRLTQAQASAALATILATLMILAGCGSPQAQQGGPEPTQTSSHSTGTSSDVRSSTDAASSPQPSQTSHTTAESAGLRAKRRVAQMSIEQQAGQLVMAPLFAGQSASSLKSLIRDKHVGSVLLLGDWTLGKTGLRATSDALQSYAENSPSLLIAADQEGGQVQHLQGPGIERMPSAVQQGTMTVATLRRSAAQWGSQLKQAGVNVNLAPVVDTVLTSTRAANAPVGALQRDFGGNADHNASHASAFVSGMRDAGVMSVIKHYPGLGAVHGNTDFTTQGITDTTTTLDGAQPLAFRTTLAAKPAMVMMSLATYAAIDASSPAAFSSVIIQRHLRDAVGYQGVVISDSLSAQALSGISVRELGVRLVDAGGDLACVGAQGYTRPILAGIVSQAHTDSAFAQRVTRSATRVLTLKYENGLER